MSTPTIREDGATEWRNEAGELHRIGDLPAVEYPDGSREWRQKGLLHRNDPTLAALVYTTGYQEWRQWGKLNREGDLPTIIDPDGIVMWHQDDLLHRDKDDLPAYITWQNERQWAYKGELHRLKGPAHTKDNFQGEVFSHFYVCGKQLTEEQFSDLIDELGHNFEATYEEAQEALNKVLS